MRVFLYEYVTGGGLWGPSPEPPPEGSLLAEGSAMIRSLAADFTALADVSVTVLRDARLADFRLPGCECLAVGSADQEQSLLRQATAAADATVLIVPEWQGELARRARLVLATGGRLLSPGPEFIELAADKHRTAEYLQARGISAPRGISLEPGQPLPRDFPFPAVLKPRDGAGSCDVRLIASPDDCWTEFQPVLQSEMRLERFYPGTAASVAALLGPAGPVVLPACTQNLMDDGSFTYLGGEVPLPPALNYRARRLAETCLAALPPTVGYIGFDLVLGDDPDGADDVVIEVNPRLTTSYVGLSALAQGNLAAAMLHVAQGESVELPFAAGPIKFRATGELAG